VEELLDHRQRRFAVRALAVPQEHPTHQLLPANFRMGQLYRHEGARDRLSSVGWLDSEKTHRTLGGRLAQQVAKVVTYDTEYGFHLSQREAASPKSLETSSDDRISVSQRTDQEQTQVLTLFAASADARTQNKNFGAGVAWLDKSRWRTRSTPLGRYLTAIDADLFAISGAIKEAGAILRKEEMREVDIVSASRGALAAISGANYQISPLVGNNVAQVKQLRSQGYTLRMVQAPEDGSTEGMTAAHASANQAARRQPQQLRSASLSYVQQSVRETKPTVAKMNKYLGDSRKSVTARYLQLKSGHAVTGMHLFRMRRVQDSRCWWCGSRQQSVGHLMFQCRKWRRERKSMLNTLASKKIEISTRMNGQDLQILFGEDGIETVLRFIESTAVGKRSGVCDTRRIDEWDIELLDRSSDEDWSEEAGRV
jgi:hypothetical protein